MVLSAVLLFAGCSSYRGGVVDETQTSSATGLRSETGSGFSHKPGMEVRNFETR